MKKTTVQWFCDKCGKQITGQPFKEYGAGAQKDFSNSSLRQYRVTIEYKDYSEKEHRWIHFKESMLCDKCKVEALEEVLKKLKAKKKEQSK